MYQEQDAQVVFGTSQEVITAGEIQTGAGMLVQAQDRDGQMVEDLVETAVSFLLSEEGIETGEPESHTIGRQDGIVVTFEGTPEDSEVPVRGLVAAAEYENWAYLFFALSVLEEWSQYGPDLQRMLDSVQFIAHTRPTTSPTESFTADEWEPDNDLVDANLIEIGDVQSHNLDAVGDHDWVYFNAEEGTIYIIQTSSLGDDVDTIIHLYDQEGNELASDDDGADEYLASRLRWIVEEEGALYVMIQDFGDNEAGPGTSYTLSLSLGEAFEADEYEPDDSLVGAREIVVGQKQTHNLHVRRDQDWIYFEAVAGKTYVIETLNLGNHIDPEIYLYDEEGNELAYDDDGAGTLASRLEWLAEGDGTLYIMVRDWRDRSAGPGTGYEILVSEI